MSVAEIVSTTVFNDPTSKESSFRVKKNHLREGKIGDNMFIRKMFVNLVKYVCFT